MGIEFPMLAVIVAIAYMVVSQLLLGGKRRKVTETSGKSLQIWSLIILAIIGIGSIQVLDIESQEQMKWFWLIFIILGLGAQALLEWKYLKGTKEYLVSLIVLGIGLIYVFLFLF